MSGATLAVSASGERFSIALRDSDAAILGHVDAEARTLSADLFTAIEGLLRPAGLVATDLDELRVDRGPGSYTGLRVALTFARVLAEQAGLRVLYATSIELMAIAAWRRGAVDMSRPVRVILDARRERFHTARVEFDAAHARLVTPPQALAQAALAALLREDEVLLAPASLAPALGEFGSIVPLPQYGALELFDPWLAARPAAPSDLEPLYLMGPYTEPAP